MNILRAAILAAAFAVSGCASIVSDTESTTYIETIPEKARCELHGQDFIRVVTTPNSIQLPAEAAPITIACKAEGHLNTSQPLDTKADGWILGNIIFGGLVGVVIDAARGAGQKYPPHVTVILEPEVFASEPARDEWFANRRKAIEEIWEKRMQTLRAQCSDDMDCRSKEERAVKEREQEFAQLEERRLRARVAKDNHPPNGPKA